MRLVLFLLVAALPSPAADRIVFSRISPTRANLFVSNADGTSERPLYQSGALDYNPAWSPKGDWIVFTSERGASADLYRVHPDGTALERLTDDPAYDDQATFSPDGKQIVFVTTRAGGTADLWTSTPPPARPARLPPDPVATSALPGRPTASGSPSLPIAVAISRPPKAAGNGSTS